MFVLGICAADVSAAVPGWWWSVAKAQDRLIFSYRLTDPSELDQLNQNLAIAQADLGNANNPTAKSLAAGNVAEAKTELANAERGYPIDLALCSGRGPSTVVTYEPAYKQFRCRISAVTSSGYVTANATLRAISASKFTVTNVALSAGN